MRDYREPDPLLSKLDVAENHVVAGFQMVGAKVNPYSVHLVTMAADEIIETIADKRKILLEYGATLRIKDEHRSDWFKAKRAANNFFKHADRDPEARYSGPDFSTLQRLNDANLAFSIMGLRALGKITPSYFTELVYAFFCLYPSWCKWDDVLKDHPKLKTEFKLISADMTRDNYESIVREILNRAGISGRR